MHYVKHFNINGIDTKQVACIELHGKPNAAIEGCVGVLGVDVDSPHHDVYKCVAVNGGIYTWELLSSGLSVLSAGVSKGGAITPNFTYGSLWTPSEYVVKVGDLILDADGYVYQVTAIGASSCSTAYLGIYLHGKSGVWVGNTAPTDDSNVWINPNGTDAAILKVKKADGSWANIPAIKGDKGDQGDKGDRGKSAYEYAREGGYGGTEAQFSKVIVDASVTTTKTEKRVTNLEAAVYGDLAQEVVDDSVAHTKNVPANAKPYARIDAVGGMTRKCTQLFDATKAQIGYRCNADGSIVKNSSYATSDYIEVRSNTSYYLTNVCGNNYCSAVLFDANKAYVNITSFGAGGKVSGVLNVDSNIKYIRINIFTDVVDINTVMVNAGTTPQPYEPYFEGLRSAKVERVESVGANLFDPQKIIDAGGTENNGEYTVGTSDFYQVWNGKDLSSVPCKKGTRYIIGFEGRNDNPADRNVTLIFTIVYTDGSQSTMVMVRGNEWNYQYAISTAGKDVSRISVTYSYSGMSYLRNVFIAEYTGDNAYTPFVKHTLPIPAEVRAKPWYGLGISKDVCNAIRWGEDGSRSGDVKCGVDVFDGTETWQSAFSSDLNNTAFSTTVSVDCFKSTTKPIGLAISNAFPFNSAGGDVADTFRFSSGLYDKRTLWFYPSVQYTLDEWKAWLAENPVTVLYELATPTTEDISDILPADNYIGVEGGGTLTFVNEYGYDVPSEVTFVTKEVQE